MSWLKNIVHKMVKFMNLSYKVMKFVKEMAKIFSLDIFKNSIIIDLMNYVIKV